MPRYHFGSVDGHPEPDEMGEDLPSLEAAQIHATKYAGEVLTSDAAMLWKHGQWRDEVPDDNGELLFTVITLAIDAPTARGER